MKIFSSNEVVMGVDPGLANTGYGIIKTTGQKLLLLDYGFIETKANKEFSDRLSTIYKELSKIILKYKPDSLAIEDLFFCKNVKSALVVGQARGVAILAGAQSKLSVFSYTPLQIKQAVIGYGRGTKEQVQLMVKMILNMSEIPSPDHAADALAASICCANDFQRKGICQKN